MAKRRTAIKAQAIDDSQFNDKVASKTDWEPLNAYTATFNTHRLIEASASLLQYKMTLSMKLFSGAFIVVGLGALAFFRPWEYGWMPEPFLPEGVPLLIFMLFLIIGLFMLYFTAGTIVFDASRRTFLKGRGEKKKSIDFYDIYALQLIPQYVSDSDGVDYENYQLNIVVESGERTHVVSYSDMAIAKKDANKIANFIGKPLWDAVELA